jgi:hypothetical protein
MSMSKSEILDREFLQMRAKILDIAAALDRQDRAGEDLGTDPRRDLLEQGIKILASDHSVEPDDPKPSRAEQVQLLFSRQYDPNWRTNETTDRT